MSEQLYHTTAPVHFARKRGILGARTNGALPQIVEGFLIDAIFTLDLEKGAVHESYWIKTVESSTPQRHGGELVAFTEDFRKVERLLSAMIDAAETGAAATLDAFDAHHNSAQIDFDEDSTSEEAVQDTTAYVHPCIDSPRSVEVAFLDGRNTIARLRGALAPEAVDKIISEFGMLREQRSEMTRTLGRKISVEGAPVPSF